MFLSPSLSHCLLVSVPNTYPSSITFSSTSQFPFPSFPLSARLPFICLMFRMPFADLLPFALFHLKARFDLHFLIFPSSQNILWQSHRTCLCCSCCSNSPLELRFLYPSFVDKNLYSFLCLCGIVSSISNCGHMLSESYAELLHEALVSNFLN